MMNVMHRYLGNSGRFSLLGRGILSMVIPHEYGSKHMKPGDLAVEIAHPLAEQLETSHFGFHQTASMVGRLFLP
ncbi:hypothetical protein [Janthinobacterium sp. HH01]|uniref:hypothetical protein n=1 Tax=Janthinobacterium sp. HH01 TaxID=1198452 RepID=UPI0005B7ACE6